MNVAILLSGGTGVRLGGDIPKQYLSLDGKSIISYSIDTLVSHEKIDAMVIVAAMEWKGHIESDLPVCDKPMLFAKPGTNRQLSIYNALKTIEDHLKNASTVFVHDAARPFLTAEMISACYKKLEDGWDEYDGVMPVLPMKDTVYISGDGQRIDSLLDRKTIFAGQAPELFKFDRYLAANEGLVKSGEIDRINGSTEPAILAGMSMAMIPGDEKNYKITTADDLERAGGILKSAYDAGKE